jgi:hypothetical protein
MARNNPCQLIPVSRNHIVDELPTGGELLDRAAFIVLFRDHGRHWQNRETCSLSEAIAPFSGELDRGFQTFESVYILNFPYRQTRFEITRYL